MDDGAADLFEIFTSALEIPEAAERAAFVEKACEGDTHLQEEVLKLLQSHAVTSGTFSRPFGAIPELVTERETKENPWLDLPRSFGDRYVLEEVIGHGGMGVVYRATQTQLNRVVALKMIRNSQLATRKEVKRFYAEARAAATLDHPGVVPVIETGQVGEQHFFSMGYVEGINLSEAVKDRGLSLPQVCYLLHQIAEALSYTHRKGVIHRDLKPGNILLSEHPNRSPTDPSLFEPRISDFGLAKIGHAHQDLTMSGEIFGTPAYMPPEQALGQGAVSGPLCDIYSFGAVMYFALTGRAPFEGISVWAILKELQEKDPAKPRELRPDLPVDLEVICLKCLRKNPEERYQSARQLVADLENFAQNRPLLAKRVSPWERFVKTCQRHPTGVVASALGALLLVAIGFLGYNFQQSLATRTDALGQPTDARTSLARSLQLTSASAPLDALRSFVATVDQATQSGDRQVETVARYGISATLNQLWTERTSVSIPSPPVSLSFSPDGHLLFFATEQNQVRLVDLDTREWRLNVQLDHSVIAHAFHPEAPVFAVATTDGTIHLWELNRAGTFEKETLLSLRLDGGVSEPAPVTALAFSTDNEILLSALEDGTLITWNYQKGRRLRAPKKHGSPVVTAFYDSTRGVFWSFCKDGYAKFWSGKNGASVGSPIEFTAGGSVTGAQLSIKGDELLLKQQGTTAGTILRLSVPSADSQGFQRPEVLDTRPVRNAPRDARIDWGRGSEQLMVLTQNEVLSFPNANQAPLRFANPLRSFAVANSNGQLATVHGGEKRVRIWRAPLTWQAPVQTTAPYNGKLLAASWDRPLFAPTTTSLLAYEEPRLLWSRTEEAKKLFAINFPSPPSESLAPASHQRSFFSFNGQPRRIVGLLPSDSLELVLETAWETEFEPPGEVAFDFEARTQTLVMFFKGVWNLQRPNLALINPNDGAIEFHTVSARNLSAITFSAVDPGVLILASERSGLVWYRPRSRRIEHTISLADLGEAMVTALANSPASGAFAIGTANREVQVFDEQSRAPISPKVLHPTRVELVEFARGGELVFSSDRSDSARIWETTTGFDVGRALNHESAVTSVSIDETNEVVLTSTATGQLRVWPLPKKLAGSSTRLNEMLQEKLPHLFVP